MKTDPQQTEGYFRLRDFEYAQPLYDLAFLLEIDAVAQQKKKPKYRTFALWKAALSLDSYENNVDRWLDGELKNADLDQVPSNRIKQHLKSIRETGTLPELSPYLEQPKYLRCMRLRCLRGLGPAQISKALEWGTPPAEWVDLAARNCNVAESVILNTLDGNSNGRWQAAHVLPPLLRLLRTIETKSKSPLSWQLHGIVDVFSPVESPVSVSCNVLDLSRIKRVCNSVAKREVMFSMIGGRGVLKLKHAMGWEVQIIEGGDNSKTESVESLCQRLDPLLNKVGGSVKSDLHLHTTWSDGAASLSSMADLAKRYGLSYIAVTDHSRSCKLQRGLTPVEWLRQSNSLMFDEPEIPVLHGIEVDILQDGSLDLPNSLLASADFVVASVHSNWSKNLAENTQRLISVIESGCVDVIGHPTSALTGKPGVPNYVRSQANVEWEKVFKECSRWEVAVEFNCFPSRFDLSMDLLKLALKSGCWISLGSDAHARSHLSHIKYGQEIAKRLKTKRVLNYLSLDEIKQWRHEALAKRRNLASSHASKIRQQFLFDDVQPISTIQARLNSTPRIPTGSKVVGLDLTGGKKPTGVAYIEGNHVETCSLVSDDDLIAFVENKKPLIVSIDSPLGLPGGGSEIDPKAGIVRLAEHELSSIGIPAYPALIDSMKELTLRGIRIKERIEKISFSPTVIESYPGAAQDILCLPRKQRNLQVLREGLSKLGLTGPGLVAKSHDEIDAITSAVVGRFFESGDFEPMGVKSESELIVPKHKLLSFENPPVICLAGKTGVGKSVVARYLTVIYGFQWCKTRDLIREMVEEDYSLPKEQKLFNRSVNPSKIDEQTLREFGLIIMDKFKQEPLRKKLMCKIKNAQAPLIVDSIRNVLDVDRSIMGKRPVYVWFVDASDSIIRERLIERAKRNPLKPASGSQVDQSANAVRSNADLILPNSGTLEELRWKIDDAFFSIVKVS